MNHARSILQKVGDQLTGEECRFLRLIAEVDEKSRIDSGRLLTPEGDLLTEEDVVEDTLGQTIDGMFEKR